MDQDFEDLFESDDEGFYDMVYRRPNRIRPRINNFEKWDNEEFLRRFRLSKPTVLNLLHQIEQQLEHITNRNHAISPLEQLLMGLRFFATGSFYIAVGDFTGTHKTTAGKIVERVCNALITLREQYIYLPRNAHEIRATQEKFYGIARFPKLIAALDCTHIKIRSPGGVNAENFRCRKGYFSLNVQAMCNASEYFTDIVARWPGASHDSTIFNNSAARARFENNEFQGSRIVGDSGYPLKNYLITPLGEPRNEPERLFNEAQVRSRNVIERTFGIWKRRFPILSIGIRCKLPLAQKIITATAILHNIAVLNRELEPPENENSEDQNHPDENIQREVGILENGVIRRELIDYFGSL